MNILLFEDEIVKKSEIERIIPANKSIKLFIANTISEMKSIFINEKIDVLLIGLNNDTSEGPDLLKSIKAFNPQVTVIVLTGMNKIEFELKCLKLGAQDVVHIEKLEDSLRPSILHAIERQNSCNKYNLAEEIAKICHWECDINTYNILFSYHFTKMIGYQIDEFDSTVDNFISLIHKDDQRIIRSKIENSVANKKPFEVGCQIRCKSGHYKHVYIVGNRFEGTCTQGPRYFGVLQDITERKISENILRYAKMEAERHVKLREEMVSIVSHDIRGPIGTMKSLIEFANNSPAPYEAAKEMNLLERIHRQSSFVLTLADQVLTLASLKNKINLNKEQVNLKALMFNALDTFSPKIHEKNLNVNVEDFDTNIKVDRLRFQQAINNVLGNAIKFSPKNGRIDVTFSEINEGTSNSYPELLKISFKDEGPGVPKNLQRAIFNKFHRGKSALEIEGIGLGLAIAIDIVKKHKGNIWVESDGICGSTFYITIPYSKLKSKIGKQLRACYI